MPFQHDIYSSGSKLNRKLVQLNYFCNPIQSFQSNVSKFSSSSNVCLFVTPRLNPSLKTGSSSNVESGCFRGTETNPANSFRVLVNSADITSLINRRKQLIQGGRYRVLTKHIVFIRSVNALPLNLSCPPAAQTPKKKKKDPDFCMNISAAGKRLGCHLLYP